MCKTEREEQFQQDLRELEARWREQIAEEDREIAEQEQRNIMEENERWRNKP